jgi:hypothetical protein
MHAHAASVFIARPPAPLLEDKKRLQRGESEDNMTCLAFEYRWMKDVVNYSLVGQSPSNQLSTKWKEREPG